MEREIAEDLRLENEIGARHERISSKMRISERVEYFFGPLSRWATNVIREGLGGGIIGKGRNVEGETRKKQEWNKCLVRGENI